MFYSSSFISLAGVDLSKMSSKKRAKLENSQLFRFWFTYLKNIALHSIKFEGLPETVSERVLQESFLYYGAAVFFKMEGQILQLPGKPAYDPTMYGDFRYSYVYGRNGFNALVRLYINGADDAKILERGISGTADGMGAKYHGYLVRDQYDMSAPLIWAVAIYAARIADAYRAMDVAVKNGKFPGIWLVPRSEKQNIDAFTNSVNDNETNIITSSYFPIDKIKYQPISQDGLKASQNFMQIIEFYISSFMEILGAPSATATDFKKANITNDELEIGGSAASFATKTRLETIQDGLDFINKMEHTNIRVTSNTETGRENDGDTRKTDVSDVQDDRRGESAF